MLTHLPSQSKPSPILAWYKRHWKAFIALCAGLALMHLVVTDEYIASLLYYANTVFLVTCILLGFMINERFTDSKFWILFGIVTICIGWTSQVMFEDTLTPILSAQIGDTLGCVAALMFAYTQSIWVARDEHRKPISNDISIIWVAITLTALLVSAGRSPGWWMALSVDVGFSIVQILIISLACGIMLGLILSRSLKIDWAWALTACALCMITHFSIELWAQLNQLDQMHLARRSSRSIYDFAGVFCALYSVNCRPVTPSPNRVIDYISPRAWVSTLPLLLAAPLALLLCALFQWPLPDKRLIVAVVVICNLGIIIRYFQLTHEANDNHRKLTRMARRDELTDQLNRFGFLEAIEEDGRKGDYFMYFDINEFKSVNDLYGHHVGDRLLCNIAKDLRQYPDVVLSGRMGGDEFAVLMRSHADIETVSASLCQALSRWHVIDGHRVHAGVSVGAIKLTDMAFEDMFRLADQSMMEAKRQGKGHAVISEDLEVINTRQDQREIVQAAIDSGDLILYYQPILCARRMAIIGTEVLLRMRDKNGRLLRPIEFLPLTRDLRQLRELTLIIPRQLQYDIDAFRGRQLHLNLPPELVVDRSFREAFYWQFRELSLPFDQFTLEITEDMPVALDQLSDAADELRDLGFRLAIDDFGSAHSSMARLAAVDVDEVKIDPFLLQAATRGKPALLETAVLIAKRLGLRTTVEGVETEAHLALVDALDVDCIQGYLLGEPMSDDDFIKRIRQEPQAKSTASTH